MVAKVFAVCPGPLDDLERLQSGESEAVDMRVIYAFGSVEMAASPIVGAMGGPESGHGNPLPPGGSLQAVPGVAGW